MVPAEQVFYYHTDPAGTPMAMTDSSGNVVWRADYKPFGEEQSVTSTVPNDKRFIGKEKDEETGFSYFGARYQNAKIGRFIAPDPVRAVDPRTNKTNEDMLLNPQRLNTYAYALNNPYRFVDPDGRETIPWEVWLSGSSETGAGGAIAAGAGTGLAVAGVGIGFYSITSAIINDTWVKDTWVGNGKLGELAYDLTHSNENNVYKADDSDKAKTRNPDPPAKRKNYRTKKDAREAAKRAGKGNEPVNHPDDPNGPHYHPGDGNGKPSSHDHYKYPKNQK